jgi:glucose/mannose-6-phosphate isomerase
MADTPLLDNQDHFESLDSTKTLLSIELIGNQIKEIWDLSQTLKISKEIQEKIALKKFAHIVVCGMGGSILGTDIIQSLFSESLPTPLTIVPNYTLPAFVNKNSLVIAASYSGGTEETWTAMQTAHKKGATIAGITSGGKIAEFLKENNYPCLQFSQEHNPSQIAKMGLGYSIFGQMMLFAKMGLIAIGEEEYKTVINAVATAQLKMSSTVEQQQNVAKLLAFQLFDRLPMVLATEHTAGAAHVFVNQLNENTKTLAEFHIIPEMNHHLLEALAFPKSTKDHISWISVESGLYLPENQKRVSVTEQVLEKQGFPVILHRLTEETRIGQVFELLILGTYTSFYLAMLNSVDPGPIPVVDWFKAELKKK